ncbi:hypothetical protein JHL18_14855 [Clostridium sp. YIM B02505]|uniref:Beta/gamma crystallin 'Greek key' domain-containing protein n=1 Tax=Clostridium yunnanense TaxID=2800325 RepID=A0ABS1ER80_9CLOT|nr:beta/gamma crystallin-related protein [Clostridium yunnanense]MBK1811899.1 hypothetical protein [Clostridium yunnanense]
MKKILSLSNLRSSLKVKTIIFTFTIMTLLLCSGGTVLLPYGGTASAATAPPATWQEHWFEHNQLVKLAYYNDDVAIYLDDDLNKANVNWVNNYTTNLWKYVKQTYGTMGGDGRLYVILHNKYGGGHPSEYYSSSHDYRNVIDVGGSDFASNTGWNLDAITHEVGHIVELASYGTQGSPAFNIWKDSKWCEIFNYDAYNGLGMTSEAQRAYNNCMNTTDSFPVAGTAWFKNWFYPIWSKYGKATVLNNYFKLLSQYYPKDVNGAYTRTMNMGEFVYFWGLAANTDLKAQATTAFGWTTDYESQLQKARLEFSVLSKSPTFYKDINYGGTSVSLTPGTYTLAQLQAKGIPNDWASSIKVPSGYTVTIYNDDNFKGTSWTLTADNSSLVGLDCNDLMTSVKITAPVTVYADVNYAGYGISIPKGTYTLNQLQAMGIPNDWVSSIKVQSGVTVEVYQDDNFLGTKWTFTADEANMVNRGCNDAMSSVKIY